MDAILTHSPGPARYPAYLAKRRCNVAVLCFGMDEWQYACSRQLRTTRSDDVARGQLKVFALLPAFALVGLTVACGAGGSGAGTASTSSAPATSSGDTVAKDDALAALVPADVKADGKIVVGQDQS